MSKFRERDGKVEKGNANANAKAKDASAMKYGGNY